MTKDVFMKDSFGWSVLAAVVFAAMPDSAFAQVSVGNSLHNFRTVDLPTVPLLISVLAYTGAAALGVSGALKLKAYAENPAQEKIASGIGRLLTAGGLAALPYLVKTALDTLHLSETAARYQSIQTPEQLIRVGS